MLFSTTLLAKFGNYVIQHVIENGDEKDRTRMIDIVMGQLLAYSNQGEGSHPGRS
jgi:hypothetical protein